MTTLAVTVNGHPLWLCAERAAFDPVSRSLFVADAHFGKGATFRAHGIPVPGGTTADNLRRLDTLIARHAPTHIYFLGDLLHAREAHAAQTQAALAQWRGRHAQLPITLVIGNHDRHAGPPPAALAIELAEAPLRVGPWALCHHPQEVDGAYALAGHEHPVYALRSRVDSVRLPCFRFERTLGVLPAFGSFTGGAAVDAARAEQVIYVVAEDRILPIQP